MDGLFVSLYGLGTVAALSDGETGVSIPLLALGTAHLVSAMVGNKSAKRCREVLAEHRRYKDGKGLRLAAKQKTSSLDEKMTTIMGEEGKACYPGGVCDDGLECEPDARICVPERRSASATDASSAPVAAQGAAQAAAPPAAAKAEAGTTARTEASTPAHTGDAAKTAANRSEANRSEADPPRSQDTTPPARETTPPVEDQRPPAAESRPPDAPKGEPKDEPKDPDPPAEGDAPWADFWREINL